MSALALELEYDVIAPDGTRHVGSLTEVLGWAGLDQRTQSVAEMFAVGAWSDDATTIGTSAYEMSTLDDPAGFAYYAKPPGRLLGLAFGNFQVTRDTFPEGSQPCGAVGRVVCTYAVGSVDAAYSFRVEDTGSSDVYVQPRTVATGLPAVRVKLVSK
jgi:hypothetical protein